MSKKLCNDTEIKAFSHWHFEFSMAGFWAVPVFCNKFWTVWSAYATADYPARPSRPHSETYQHKRPLDDGSISLFTFLAGRTKEQVLDKGIRQKSIKRVGSIVVCSAFCPGSPKRDPLDFEKMVYTCIHILWLTVGKRFACIYTSTHAKWLRTFP